MAFFLDWTVSCELETPVGEPLLVEVVMVVSGDGEGEFGIFSSVPDVGISLCS